MANVINATSTGNGGLVSTGDDSGILNIQTNETTAITVDARQNVGIGVSSSLSYILQLQKNGTQIWNDCQSSYLEQSLTLSSGANIDWYQSTKGTGNFIWRQAGTTERMRIDSSGNLLVGQSSTIGTGGRVQVISNTDTLYSQTSSNTAYAALILNVQNTAARLAAFQYGNTTAVGTITTNGTTTSYNVTSDYRLKENIVPLTGALAKISQLKPSTYNYKSKPEESIEGFIAHELQSVIPHAVTGDKDAVDADGKPLYQGVDASFLIPHLVAAIQELKAINDTQAATINALTARIVALEGA